MTDLVTRLLLNSTQFDNNIRSSAQQVQQFQNITRNVTSMVGKFAGALGLAMTANEAFNRTIAASETLTDAYEMAQMQANTAVNTFFNALSQGDFSGFLGNLENAIKRTKDFKDALNELEFKTVFNEAETSELNTRYQIEINAAKARNISDAERNRHLAKAKQYLQEMTVLQKSLSSSTRDVSYKELNAYAAEKGITRPAANATWDYIIKDSNRDKVDESAKRYETTIAYLKQKISASTKINKFNGEIEDTAQSRILRQQLKEYEQSANGQYGKLASVFTGNMNEQAEKMKDALDRRRKSDDLAVAISQRELEIANTYSKINGSYASLISSHSTNLNKSKELLPTGSMAELDSEISKKKMALNLAVNQEDRVRINKELNELTEKKRVIEFTYQYPASPSKISDDERKGAGLPLQSTKRPDKLQSYVQKKDVKNINDYAEGLQSVAGVLNAVNSLTSEGITGWLQWGATVMTSVAAVIPAIQTLITAKTAEAGTSAVASAAQTPVVGWLLAGAAVASVMAALASLPKFAEGGVFTGNSTIGDMNLARVNAGEMILNNRQQKNLFNLLNSGSVSNSGNSEVTFKIQGKELVGVLNNYSNRQNKIR